MHYFRLTLLVLLLSITPLHAMSDTETTPIKTPAATAYITFAGGCFWCMEPPFDKLDGVISTTSGYMGGHLKDPSYKDVSGGKSGHIEVMQVAYNPEKVTLDILLNTFWRNVDPLDAGGQFCDRGEQYSTAIFYHDDAQKKASKASKKQHEILLNASITTIIRPAEIFYPAEEYHQDFYKKNSIRYRYYRQSCGRDQRLETLWQQ